MTHAPPTAYAVLPGDVDDPTVPSGGNRYDREVCRGLTAAGWQVHELALPGAWPHPTAAERARLEAALDQVPDGADVLVDGLVGCGVPEVLVPRSARLRLVVVVHLPLAAETGMSPETAAALDAGERATLRVASEVVATSPAAARGLARRHGLAPGEIRVIPPGVDPAPLATGTDSGGELICVAALTPRKGQDRLVTALAEVAQRHPELPWRCTLIGSLDRAPAFVTRVRELIARHRLGERVTLAGPRIGAELAASYAGADLGVLPSHAETYGMVVTEALARGVPVVASDVDGVSDALGRAPDGSLPGMLVPPDSPAAWPEALRRWLTEPGLRRRLQRSARERRETLTGWDVTSRHVADLLTRADQLRGAI